MPLKFAFKRQSFRAGLNGSGNHAQLSGREAAGQHPISAVTGLAEALDGKQPAGNYLTEHQSLSAYRTAEAQDAIDAGFLTEHQSLSAYRTAEAQDAIDAGFLTEHQSLSAYRTAEAQDAIDAGFLTEHQSLSAYRTAEAQDAIDAGFLTEHQSLSAYRTAEAQDAIDAGLRAEITAIEAAALHPTEKTAAMTQAVGKDGSGRLWTAPGGGSGGGSTWGGIGGTLADQTDLKEALDGKQPAGNYLTEHQSLSAYRTAAAQDIIDADKQSKISVSGLLKGNGSGDIVAAEASDIPSLAASKITSGTFASARIPSLAASKITSGTFASARIPSLAASKITSGTFPDDRIASAATWNGKYTKPSDGIPESDLASDVQAALSGAAKTAFGTYVGTGVYGESNQNSLTFSFVPKMLFVQAASGNVRYSFAVLSGCSITNLRESSSYSVRLQWNSETVTWYSSSGADKQLNDNTQTYVYLAVG